MTTWLNFSFSFSFVLNLLGCFASILSNGSEKSQSNRTVSHKI